MTGFQFDENGMFIIPDTTTADTPTTGPRFDDNGMLVIPAAQPAPTEPQPQGETSGAGVSVSAETEEGASFLEEAYRAVVGGVRDGAQEIGETAQWAGESIGNAITGGNDIYWTRNDGFEWLSQDEAKARDDIPEWQTRDLFGKDGTLSLPEVEKNKTVAGGMVRGVTQFVAGYGAVGKSLKLAKATTKTGAVVKGLGQGAATDFVAFDAHEDRLSDLVQSVPALQNPLTDWLEAEADDSILEGKLKNAVEGLGLGVAMEAELSTDVIWSLRALAQHARAQRELYPDFAVVADELVMDFDAAYSNYKETTRTKHADLERLDAHIASKSGVLEFWTDEALDRSAFWNEIRQQAEQALEVRGLTTFAPHPSSNTFASESEVWASGRNIETPSEDTPLSVFKKFLNLFR